MPDPTPEEKAAEREFVDAYFEELDKRVEFLRR